MSMQTEEKYIRFEDAGTSPSGVTQRWRVVNIHRERTVIGTIKWYGANGFRGYCFYPYFDEHTDWILFSPRCMRAIADFCDARMQERKKKV